MAAAWKVFLESQQQVPAGFAVDVIGVGFPLVTPPEVNGFGNGAAEVTLPPVEVNGFGNGAAWVAPPPVEVNGFGNADA